MFRIFTFFFATLTSFVFAQSNSLDIILPSSGNIINSQLITLVDTPGSAMGISLDVKNKSTQTVNVHVFRSVIQEVIGQQNKFCFGPYCYSLKTDSSKTPIAIIAGNTNTSFHADYFAFDSNIVFLNGVTIIRYTFYNAQQVSDRVFADVTYNTSTSTAVIYIPEEVNHLAFPNPFTENIQLKENGISNLEIYDCKGTLLLKENELPKSRTLELNNFEKGVYFLFYQKQGKTFYQKLIKT